MRAAITPTNCAFKWSSKHERLFHNSWFLKAKRRNASSAYLHTAFHLHLLRSARFISFLHSPASRGRVRAEASVRGGAKYFASGGAIPSPLGASASSALASLFEKLLLQPRARPATSGRNNPAFRRGITSALYPGIISADVGPTLLARACLISSLVACLD